MFLVLKWDDGHHWFLIQLVDNNLRKILTISRITLLNSFLEDFWNCSPLEYMTATGSHIEFPISTKDATLIPAIILESFLCQNHPNLCIRQKYDKDIDMTGKLGIYVISIFIFYLLLKFHPLSSEPKWRVFYFSSGGSLGHVSYKCNAYVWLLVGIKTFTFSIVIINSFISFVLNYV